MFYSVVIPTYGEVGVELTDGALKSARINQLRHEIIVVDDGSGPEVWEQLSKICEEEQAEFLYNESNLGFAKTCNVGMRESNGDVVILMNNDVRMIGPSLDFLADATKVMNAGVMGIRLLYPDYTIQHAGQIFAVGPDGGYFDHYCRHRPRYYPEATVIRKRLVTGAFYAISRPCIDAIGFLDEKFGMAVEDVDYSLSAMEAGLGVVYNGQIEAFHMEGKTRGNTLDAKDPKHLMAEMLGLQYLFEKWRGVEWASFTPKDMG